MTTYTRIDESQLPPRPTKASYGNTGQGRWQLFARHLLDNSGEWYAEETSSPGAAKSAVSGLRGNGRKNRPNHIAERGAVDAYCVGSTVYARAYTAAELAARRNGDDG